MFSNLLKWCILRDKFSVCWYVYHFCLSGMIKKYGCPSPLEVVMSVKLLQMLN